MKGFSVLDLIRLLFSKALREYRATLSCFFVMCVQGSKENQNVTIRMVNTIQVPVTGHYFFDIGRVLLEVMKQKIQTLFLFGMEITQVSHLLRSTCCTTR